MLDCRYYQWRRVGLTTRALGRATLSQLLQCMGSRIRFYVFFKIEQRDFLRFLKCYVKKRKKNAESVVQVFSFVHFEIAN